jgi:pimeloyl-ACP methyl ester carboxylesterase
MPQDPVVVDEKDPRFLDDPYTPGGENASSQKSKAIRRKVLDFLEKQLDGIFFDEQKGIKAEKISEFLVQKLFRDLDVYYHRNCVVSAFTHLKAKDAVRERLVQVLRRYRRKKILLIAHSMGTIISYDVLSHPAKDIAIDTFITIGSPLGLPLIMKKIFEERGMEFKKGVQTPTPENISKRWLNFSDLSDPVAMNYDLADDYAPNSRGVGPIDFVVDNDYAYRKKRNHHKLYGYLRAPEVAKAISDFLESK